MALMRFQLRDKVAAVLLAAGTTARNRVYVSRDWPLPPDVPAAIAVWAQGDRKTSLGKAAPLFSTSAIIGVQATVQGNPLSTVQAALDTLCGEIESALIGDGGLLAMIEQISAVVSNTRFSGEGTHLGECLMEWHLDYTEQFPLVTGADEAPPLPLVEIQGQLTDPDGTDNSGAVWPEFDIKF